MTGLLSGINYDSGGNIVGGGDYFQESKDAYFRGREDSYESLG